MVAFAVFVLIVATGAFIERNPFNSRKAPSSSAMQSSSASSRSLGGNGSAESAKPADTAGALPPSLGSHWKLTYNAAFEGSRLDTSKWGTCYPWESQQGCANFGNSDEYQWYMPSQDQVYGGALHIVAQKEATTGHTSDGVPEGYSYRSGMVTSYPGYKFQYGYIQIEARIPAAQGLWSALWLAAANKQWPPEIDILEHWDASTDYYEYYHPTDAPREDSFEKLGNLSTAWHAYGVYWTQSEITWFIDGHPVMKSSRNVPQQPMYFLANVAVYHPQESLQTPAAMLIKGISVWQSAG